MPFAFFAPAAIVTFSTRLPVSTLSLFTCFTNFAWLRAHAGLVTLALALLCAPAVLVHALLGRAVFEFELDGRAADRRIASLLAGERLVPPPGLPPDVFASREVESIRPTIMQANRDWNLLDPAFSQRLLEAFRLMRDRHGYEVVLVEGYRSAERQTMLAALGPHVTRARANMSYHQFGLAADCAFLRDGRLVISARDPWAMRGYELLGQIAEETGLNWGGRWTLHDFGHVELRTMALPGGPRS